ncbi:putative membrane protein [Plasmodium reichenowi]|uniref:Putative membrane protein n=1 Tax=Plasmodium reichenowi TaxID=5854 RepID=A0A151L5S1_PLARE|nr:putative membrane protein [Plasmodium reichenowi]KYN94289.1 putative membrane protein [Plasmodium reichenowi]
MLMLYLHILLCIFLNNPVLVTNENNFFIKILRSQEKKIENEVSLYEKLNNRILLEGSDDFSNLDKLKSLLSFQKKIDKTIRKKQKEENKLKKFQQAIKNGNNIYPVGNNPQGFEKKEREEKDQEKKYMNNAINKINEQKGNYYEPNKNINNKYTEDVTSNGLLYNKDKIKNQFDNTHEEKFIRKHEHEREHERKNEHVHVHETNSKNYEEKPKKTEYPNINFTNILNSIDFYKKIDLVKNYFGYNNNETLNQNIKEHKNMQNHNVENEKNNMIQANNQVDENQNNHQYNNNFHNEKNDNLKQDTKDNSSEQTYNNSNNNIEDNNHIKFFISKDIEEKKNKQNDINESVYNAIKNQNLHLRRNNIKEIFDVDDLVKNIKSFLGIKSNIHEAFENQKLIIKNCNYESFGPELCSVDEKAKEMLWKYEKKKNSAFLFIILFTLFFSLIIQNIVYFIEKKVRNSKDQFRKDLLNTAFRQISLITIINLTIWGILQTNIAEAFDEVIFNDILPRHRNIDGVLHNVEPLLEVIFEKILFISMNFLICYSIFIVSIHFVTRTILKWFSESDNSDVASVAKEVKESQRKCFRNYFFFFRNVRNSKYLAHRYDFSENVDAISIPGLDPNGYYYYEYMRASLLKYNVKLIKIPNAVILFLIFVCISLRPFYNIRLKAEVIFLNVLSLICIIGLISLFVYLYRIDTKLLPRDISKYLLNKYHIETCDKNKRDVTPYYKLLKQESVYPSALNYFFYKTTFPNKHEQLFLLWGNGPSLINFIFQTLCFCFLIILSCWIFLLRVDNITWFQLYSYGSLSICVCILVFFFILKYIIYYNVMVTKTGYLIDTKLLEQVWEYERSDNIKRISEFIDAIKIKSTLHALKEGGEIFWRQLLIKSSTVPSNIQEKMFSIWIGLDEENRGIIDSSKILKFLKSQGINLTSEHDIREFLEVFDRNNKNGLNQEEFFVLIIIVKQILVELLDINAVQSLFEEVYGIPWKSLSSIDVNSLKKILTELNLKWPHGKIRNLIDFVCENKKTKYVSAEYFIKQLINIEEVTLQPFHSASDSK